MLIEYEYNIQNIVSGEEITVSYAYDGTGTRIGKTVNGVSTGQIWNNGNVIAEYGTKGIKSYIRGAGGEIVKAKDSTNNNRYFSYNAHGDTTNIIEKNAESTSFAVTAAYEYDAFGGLATGTGGEADSNAFRYNGQYTDEETGLIYLRNRYYDPEIGRFTQEDPYWNPGNMIYGDSGNNNIPSYESISQSANLYVYCASDPINSVDPTGENWVVDKLGEIANYALKWGYWAQKQAQRDFWWCGAEWYLKPNGYLTSAWMLENSLQDNPEDQWRGDDSRIASLIKNDPEFLNLAYNCIDAYGYQGDFYCDGFVAFQTGDLYYSLHKSNVSISAYDMGYGVWVLNCSLTDTCDYTEITTLMGNDMKAGLGTIANDVATVSQWSGAINPYNITVEFSIVIEV